MLNARSEYKFPKVIPNPAPANTFDTFNLLAIIPMPTSMAVSPPTSPIFAYIWLTASWRFSFLLDIDFTHNSPATFFTSAEDEFWYKYCNTSVSWELIVLYVSNSTSKSYENLAISNPLLAYDTTSEASLKNSENLADATYSSSKSQSSCWPSPVTAFSNSLYSSSIASSWSVTFTPFNSVAIEANFGTVKPYFIRLSVKPV